MYGEPARGPQSGVQRAAYGGHTLTHADESVAGTQVGDGGAGRGKRGGRDIRRFERASRRGVGAARTGRAGTGTPRTGTPGTGVRDSDCQATRLARDADADGCAWCVFQHVGEGFLNDAVRGELDDVRECAE